MTADATMHTPPPTSVSPTARQVWTRTRGIVLALVVLLAAAAVIAALRSDGRHGMLDPRSADPYGSRAVAALLDEHGVTTRVVTTLDEARAAADPDTTLLVATPDLLTRDQQNLLRTAIDSAGGRTVLVAPGAPSAGGLVPGVTAARTRSTRTTLDPACAFPAARRAGGADTGGIRYSTTAPATDSCYPDDGLPTLLRLARPRGGDTVVLGSPDILLNKHLGDHGNASLALQLLGSRPHLVWYLPSLADDTAPRTGQRSFFDLLPSGWLWAALQLFLAAAVAALWRARRLGPLVPERLPVAIRASETTEGRARLYRTFHTRDRAAAALRSATRIRLAPLVGVPAAQAHTPETLLPALSARLAAERRAALNDLLFGPPPGDDAALVLLADRLDALEREVRRP
ncbi:DUF4350 domain-containing protein [Streptomyces thermoviolaceus]|uniref:DUF4350 domain-containing protein n=1 Tax=Streptomyces thermoviolaceus TaxID=1952 RepID=UPI0033BC987D